HRHIRLGWYAGRGRHAANQEPPDLHAGERWRLSVRLKRPHGNFNPHGFDYEAWLLERDIRATGYVRIAPGNGRLTELVVQPGYLIERLRERVARRFQHDLAGRPYVGVLQALTVGDQQAIPAQQWQVFARTGITHLISISGLHVTMVSGAVFALFSLFWRSSPVLLQLLPARKAAVLAGMFAALGYALLAGFAVPAQRTVYMLAVVALALWSGRTASASLVLVWALVAVAALDPWAVLAPGFWLSFAAVALIFYVSASRVGHCHWLRQWVRVQWALTLGLAPLLLALFQQVSLISPVANAFAIPVVSLLVTPLALAAAVLPWNLPLQAAHALMAACMLPLEFLSRLPDAVWQQHAPPGWTVICAVVGALWLLLPRGFPARWLGWSAMAPMFLVLPLKPEPGALWLSVLDVGQGQAVVAQTAHHALLYDAGPRFSSESDSGNRIVVPFLRSSGISALDGMIVTHDDIDHYGGAQSVLAAVPVGWLASPLPALHPVAMAAKRALPCYDGQRWEWDGVRFEVLHPTWASYRLPRVKDNDRGCVLKISTASASVLLTADIERVSEEDLIARHGGELPSSVLLVPHHGSKTSSSDRFVRRIGPSVAVVTAGYLNRFGHPKGEVLERYRALGASVRRTDKEGAVLLRFGPARGIELRLWRQAERRYWHEEM
ncbi:MAG: DNA internalization-related competence protein ComEC/Rec2, partial [Sulfuricellaceae bacterium]|nr:DNA internalization-related competence protein ComEC/Rec2 [Sulfuricellaceae bacterium]